MSSMIQPNGTPGRSPRARQTRATPEQAERLQEAHAQATAEYAREMRECGEAVRAGRMTGSEMYCRLMEAQAEGRRIVRAAWADAA